MLLKTKEERDKFWNEKAKALVGRKIVHARYMGAKEAENCGWDHRPVVLQLDDGSLIFPQSDDEGNDAGVLIHYTKESEQILPVLS